MRFKYTTILKRLIDKDPNFQTYFISEIEYEKKQFKEKKALDLYNRPKKMSKKESIKDVSNEILERNNFQKIDDENPVEFLSSLLDTFIKNESLYDYTHEQVLGDFNTLILKIKDSWFISKEERSKLQELFTQENSKLKQLREICLFNLTVFACFIYFYESKEVQISEIETYLKTNNISYKFVPTYENTIKYEIGFDKLGFFFSQQSSSFL